MDPGRCSVHALKSHDLLVRQKIPCYVLFNIQIIVQYIEQVDLCQEELVSSLTVWEVEMAVGAASSCEDQEEFVAVAQIDELAPGNMKRFVVLDRALVLANIDGSFHAFEDRCLHWGVKLSNGCLEGNTVRCRAHGWKHDVVRGEIVASEPPGDEGRRVRTFKIKIRDRTVFVGGNIASPKANTAR